MSLTGKQKSVLKTIGQTMPEDLRLGKAGIDDAFVSRLSNLLNRKELVKLRFTEKFEGAERRAFADEICAAVEAECVGLIGRVVLIYRANPDLEPDKRVLRE